MTKNTHMEEEKHTKTGCALGHKSNFDNFQKINITQSVSPNIMQ